MQYLQINLLDIPVCDISWWHWLLAMLVPFLLGYLLRHFLSGKLKAQIGTLESEKASLEADLKKAKSIKMATPVVASVDKTELNSLKDKVRDLETHNAKLKVDIGEAMAVKQQFVGINIDAMKKRIAELEGVEAKLSGDVESQKAFNASLTANTGDLDSLKAKLTDSQIDVSRMNAQINALKAELGGITRDNESVNNLRNDVRDLSGKVGALTVENERLKQKTVPTVQVADNSAELDAAIAALATAESSSAASKARILELEAAISALQASATTATASSDETAKAAAEAADAKAKLSEAAIEAGNLRLRLEQLTAETGTVKAQVSGLSAENEDLKAKLAAAQAAHEADKMSFAAAAPVAAPAAPIVPDDLKIIEGIGPKIEELYNAAGIFTFKQLIATPVEKQKQILVDAGSRFQMHDPTTWAEQARLADEGKMDELKALQDRLNAGKE
jgi:predicted flap endonuclease-1-like 5' DNA nuclease/predicted  nucleic acid-binding Zn-ribbon protein